ncbi:MAG: hypothetical protein ACI8QZ_000521 [Chlamydiales bacterium]|jgi:hypothetical protein
MNRTYLTLLAGLALCTLAASRFDAFVAAGIWTGFATGAGLGLFNVAWQRYKMRVRPDQLMAAMVMGFLLKLVVALVGALALRYIDPLPELADWRGYLVAFACSAFMTLVSGSLDNAGEMKRETAL